MQVVVQLLLLSQHVVHTPIRPSGAMKDCVEQAAYAAALMTAALKAQMMYFMAWTPWLVEASTGHGTGHRLNNRSCSTAGCRYR